MTEYIPYTYLIGWTKHNKWYYGSETATNNKVANPANLWKTYFTSSKHVKKFRKEHGEPDVIKIRALFETKSQAMLWEHKVLRRLKAPQSEKWLNKSDTKVHYRTGVPHLLETRQKMRLKRAGRKPALGHKDTPESRKLKSEKRRQWLLTDEGKQWREKQKHNITKLNPPFTKEQLSVWNKDPVIIAKRAAGNKGKKRTPEQKKRISDARLKYLKGNVSLR